MFLIVNKYTHIFYCATFRKSPSSSTCHAILDSGGWGEKNQNTCPIILDKYVRYNPLFFTIYYYYNFNTGAIFTASIAV